MTTPARRWRTSNGWETEEEGEAALRFKRRFRSVWHRQDRAMRRHRHRHRRRLWRRARRPLLVTAAIAGCLEGVTD